MLSVIYLCVGYFFAGGVLTGLLTYSKQVRAKLQASAYAKVDQNYVSIAITLAFLTWFLWLPMLVFGIIVVCWLAIFKNLGRFVRFGDFKAEAAHG